MCRQEGRPDRTPAEVALAHEPHRAVAERSESEQEVQRGSRAAHRYLVDVRRKAPRAAGDAPSLAGRFDPNAERAQRLDRERHVPGGGPLDDRALPVGERSEHQRPMGVVLGRRNRELAHERGLGSRYQQAHRRQDNVALPGQGGRR